MKQIKNTLLLAISLLAVISCNVKNSEVAAPTETPGVSAYYKEQHRPQFHFSPERMWMNDPNGMVYYEGEYHLFYQHYPDSNVWGPMHWGHAVSPDMVHWEHLPIALYPDTLGYIFSGSAVVDWNNTSGFGSADAPPLIAIYTYHDPKGAEAETNDFQTQGIAYSTDKGRNWTKYEGNPVIPNPGIRDFRDPKVIWHQPSKNWVMIFAAYDHVKLYSSPNLIDWQLLSEFGQDQGSHGGVWECPDLFPLTTETGEEKWVMIVSLGDGAPNGGSGTQYFIGDFDGKIFSNDNPKEEVLWIDYGRDNYAGVTWSDISTEDGRRIFLGWMSNWKYAQVVPTEVWRSAMTIPRELQLRDTEAGLRLASIPVQELESLHLQSQPVEEQLLGAEQSVDLEIPLDPGQSLIELALVPETGAEFVMEISNEQGQKVQVGFNSVQNKFYVDRRNSGKTGFSEDFSGIHSAPRISRNQEVNLKIYLDGSSLEVFSDNGEVVMTELVFPDSQYSQIKLVSSGGSTQLKNGKITGLKSIW